ncbi:MAG: SusC/RagA family TonB-linked outer membrane protein [Gemmatimonadetes bacterium]|nr:MAG: SusC/RagA family TonB-linked outer membrane protein [Gemmatimonadota bacterium]
MRITVYGRASAIVALVAGLAAAAGIRVANAQDADQPVQLAAVGPRFLAPASSGADVRWKDASNAAVFRKTISVDLKDVPLREALSAIAREAGLHLTYSGAVVPLDARVTFSASHLTVGAVLSAVLYDAGVDVLLTANGQAALVKRGALDALQVGAIVGRVTDSVSGQGIAVATVAVEGTALSSRSGDDGRYRIADVPAGPHTVKATRIGYRSVSKAVTVVPDQDAALDFALAAHATELEQVVAIGYGTTERRELTGAVSSVTSEQVAAAPVTSLDEALLGRAPGVEVVTSSGQPGAVAMVRIRGGNSISAGNDPLYVIDGVPVSTNLDELTTSTLLGEGVHGMNPIAGVSPNDIESIEILKDAAAGAIYGARAANGVVLITTKHGRSGENAVSFGSYYGIQDVRRTLPLLDATQFARMVNTAYTNAGQAPVYTPADIAAFGKGTDWQNAIFRNAPMRSYDLSFSGGDAGTTYFVSGSLLQHDGVVIGSDLSRGSFRLNLDRKVSRRLRIGNRLAFSRSQANVLPNGGAASVMLDALTAPPTLPVKVTGGEYFTGVNPLTGRPFPNPVATAMEITNQEWQNRVIGNAFAEYDVREGLTLRSTVGMDFLNSVQDYYSPSTVLPGSNSAGDGSRGEAQTLSWSFENTVHFNRRFGDRYTLDLLAGTTLQRTNTAGISGTSQGFPTDALGVNGLGAAKTFVGVYPTAPHSSLVSYFSRARWGIADKYLLTVSGRIDGSSKFGAGHLYGFFPSAALAWRASEEGFVKRLGWFDDLKLRASYGRTGNQDIPNYGPLARVDPTVYVFGGNRGVGFVPTTLANPDLRWETTDGIDLGVDATFLKSRIAVTADYYHKKTHDLLYYVPVPGTSGFSTSLQNIGSLRNRGFELSLSTVNLAGVVGWQTTLNLAWNRNKVLDLGPDTIVPAPVGIGGGAHQNPTLIKVGEPINTFYGWVYAGVDTAGQPVYKDLDGDGLDGPGDRTILGNAQPTYTGGFSNRLTYRNFELSLFLQWSVGNKIYNINRSLLTTAGGVVNQLEDVAAGGPGIPRPKIGNTFESRESDLFIEDGSYLRGKNIRLAYTFPASWLHAMHLQSMSRMQLYVSAQNFFTVTNYTGYDPEITEYARTNLAQGFDYGTYPQVRQVTFGFTAGF